MSKPTGMMGVRTVVMRARYQAEKSAEAATTALALLNEYQDIERLAVAVKALRSIANRGDFSKGARGIAIAALRKMGERQ